MDNDYSLLRPFDLDATKNGEPICYADGGSAKFLAHESGHPYLKDWGVIALSPTGISTHGENGHRWRDEPSVHDLRMAPLCWVEGKPVYKGDELWHKRCQCIVTAHHMKSSDTICEKNNCGSHLENLTWEIPKKQLKFLAYIDRSGHLFWRKEGLEAPPDYLRVPSEDKIIELEQS